jgi:hypothetical protein
MQTEITNWANLIQEVLEYFLSKLFPESTRNILLIYHKSVEENSKY